LALPKELIVDLPVVGAGVGRTGTHSLKIALERLCGGPCHHMMEILGDPAQIPSWMAAIDGETVDWRAMLANYRSLVDWPGAAFYRELAAVYPDSLVLLSIRDPESWYRSAANTIFLAFEHMPPEAQPWIRSVRKLLHDRFCDDFDNRAAMIDAFVRHNETVQREIPASRLLVWQPGDGWEPICERLGVAVPDEPFPVTNTTDEFRAMLGMSPLEH
jgi:uncharacterized protein YndB with AHSA1/START domain